LQNISDSWSEDVVARLGLGSASYRKIRHANTASRHNPHWPNAQMKLNQIVSVKGPWRDPSSNELEPLQLDTIHFEMLGTWKGTGDLVWNSQLPLRLSFKELPHGHSYDAEGFVILPEPIALQSFAVATPQDTLPSQYPRDHIDHNNAHLNAAASDTSPHDSDRQTAADRLNAPEIPSLDDQQVSRAAEMRPERQLRSMQQGTSLGKRARNEDDTHRIRERNSIVEDCQLIGEEEMQRIRWPIKFHSHCVIEKCDYPTCAQLT